MYSGRTITTMKQILLLALIITFSNTALSQDYVTIEHIGITNKPFTKLIVKDSQSVVDIPFRLKIPYPIKVINLDNNMYCLFVQILKKIADRTIEADWKFGSFEINIKTKDKTEKYFVTTIESSIIYFSSLLSELKCNKANNNELTSQLEFIIYRLSLNKKSGWSQ